MFLIRLLYLADKNSFNEINVQSNDRILESKDKIFGTIEKSEEEISNSDINKNTPINQIKNYYQEDKIEKKKDPILLEKSLNSFKDLIKICEEKKELKLKYELETNINLVKFENKRIEISFNDKLEKNFIKDITNKLFEWTNERWIITLSKEQGSPSIKQKKKIMVDKKINEFKATSLYKEIKDLFPDAQLLDVMENKNKLEDE